MWGIGKRRIRIPTCVKKRMLGVKYYFLRYSKQEIFVRSTLSNYTTDSIKEVGLLISTAFMASSIMNISLRVAIERLKCPERYFFCKTRQYYKALLFLQKICMQSESAKEEIRKNYHVILPFVFYNKTSNSISMNIRLLSISILKQINSENVSYEGTHTTFITCISQQG
ncbi:hypothetical protein NEOKW01_1755 [Nematocida sp. AWRm80]|nr:hypothetical protein NEOKW01_1755 [Nematocida sp. AWRm80]